MKLRVAAVAAAVLACLAPLRSCRHLRDRSRPHERPVLGSPHDDQQRARRVHESVGQGHGRPANPTATIVEATIDTTSIDTRNEKRDEHLRSPDFLDTAKFPTMTFKSTKVEKAGDAWKLAGDLTLHGVTKPVVLDVTNVTAPTKDPWGNTRIGASATTKISRQDFGIIFNKTLDGGGVLVGDEIAITIDVEVVQKGDGAK
jgi:polyisoprenoid-binding protein YceI